MVTTNKNKVVSVTLSSYKTKNKRTEIFGAKLVQEQTFGFFFGVFLLKLDSFFTDLIKNCSYITSRETWSKHTGCNMSVCTRLAKLSYVDKNNHIYIYISSI